MRFLSNCGAAILLLTLAAAPAVSSEAQVDVKGVHLCCQKCVTAVDDALSEVFRELGRVIRWEPTELEISSPLSALALIVLLVAGGLGLRWQRRVP